MNLFTHDAESLASDSEYDIMIVHTSDKQVGAKMLEIVRANAGKNKKFMSNYTLQEDLRIFYARKLNALFYIDNTKHNTVIFTDSLELKQFHALQMTLPKYLPTLFKENPLTERETALLKSLGNKTAVEYEQLISEFASELDIRSEIIRTKLAGFETVFEKIRIDELKNEIKCSEENYENDLSDLRKLSDRIQERKYTLAGLECSLNGNTDDSELMEYFMCNKNLTIITVDGTSIEFVVHGYADIYDAEVAEKYIQNHNGFMATSANPDSHRQFRIN